MSQPHLKKHFPGRQRVFIAVIHLVDPDSGGDLKAHAKKQVDVAAANGADGVFLIPAVAKMPPSTVKSTYELVRKAHPKLFIGINFMSEKIPQPLPAGLDALWMDSGCDFNGAHKKATDAAAALVAQNFTGLVFFGFLFKGKTRSWPLEVKSSDQKYDLIAKTVAEFKAKLMPPAGPTGAIMNTSGPGTGNPLETDRRILYRKAIGENGLLACASGVTVSNAAELLEDVDIVIVGTGIEASPTDPNTIQFYKEAGIPCAKVGYLDAKKVKELADVVHAKKALKQMKCSACEGKGMIDERVAPSFIFDKLSKEEAGKMLARISKEWEMYEDDEGVQKIRRAYRVRNFMEGMAFLNQVAHIAESEGHHPDVHLESYQFVSVVIYTHSVKGLTDNDFILAAKIDDLKPKLSKRHKPRVPAEDPSTK